VERFARLVLLERHARSFFDIDLDPDVIRGCGSRVLDDKTHRP
jgi:hypothetical protein